MGGVLLGLLITLQTCSKQERLDPNRRGCPGGVGVPSFRRRALLDALSSLSLTSSSTPLSPNWELAVQVCAQNTKLIPVSGPLPLLFLCLDHSSPLVDQRAH